MFNHWLLVHRILKAQARYLKGRIDEELLLNINSELKIVCNLQYKTLFQLIIIVRQRDIRFTFYGCSSLFTSHMITNAHVDEIIP